MNDKTCDKCGLDGLAWKEKVNGKWRLHTPDGVIHECPDGIVTRAEGVTRTRIGMDPGDAMPASTSLSDELQSRANAAVMDSVAKVTDSFHRSIEKGINSASSDVTKIIDEYASEVGSYIQKAVTEAKTQLLDMIPQVHEIHVIGRTEDLVLQGRPHYQMDDILFWISLRRHTFVSGPAGGGKSTAAEMCAEALGLPYTTVPCGMGTNDWSLLGNLSPVDGHLY